MKRVPLTSLIIAALIAALPLIETASANTVITTPNGTWTAYPGQQALYQTSVQQPINTDGSSNFKANGKAVIPVKLTLSKGIGAFVFESIFSDNPSTTADDFSFLSWKSSTPLTFKEITELIADYEFTDGNCAGGSLRWTVRLNDGGVNRNLDIHYQPGDNGLSDQFCAPGTSEANLIESTDTIYVINNFTYSGSPYVFGSAYNTTYNDAVFNLGDLPVVGITLIVDSGWERMEIRWSR